MTGYKNLANSRNLVHQKINFKNKMDQIYRKIHNKTKKQTCQVNKAKSFYNQAFLGY
jgi:hypothetical protein